MNLLKNYSLSIVLVILFLVSWLGQGYFQWKHENDEAESHNEILTQSDFKDSFLASTFENWQSEFLQLASMIILTSFLIHKGSPESKDSDEKMERKIDEILRNTKKK